ncbi:MAG: guanylate kinase [Acutalibacteraceae bacterium]
MNKGVLFIVSAASATGKDTIVSRVIKDSKGEAVISVSMTTRKPRENEKDGVNYYFVSEDEFRQNIAEGQMLEYAQYGRFFYGTPLKPVMKWLDEGKIVFLIIEVKGAQIVREKLPEAKSIFLLPPSMQTLESRLRGRNSDTEESIIRRMDIAKDEIARAAEFDYIIMNDDLETAVSDFSSICRYEISRKNGLQADENDCAAANRLKKDNMINSISEVLKND